MIALFGGFVGLGGQELCILLFAIPIALLIGGAILMGACALFNKMAGASATGREALPPHDPSEERPAVSASSTGIQEQPDQGSGGIQEQPSPDYGTFRDLDRDLNLRRVVGVPQPDLLKAMGIVLVVMVVQFIVNFIVGMSLGVGGAAMLGPLGRRMGGAGDLLASLVTIPLHFLIEAGLLTAMLPTTFGKGALVALIPYAILLVIGLVLGILLVTCMGVALAPMH